MRTCLALLLAPGAALDPLAKLQVVSLARPPESQLLSAKLSVDDVACWKWKEAAMGDGAGSSCNGVERALAQRLRADGGECVVLSTCARLDVYAYGCGDVADAVAADVGGLASQFRRSRPFAPRYGDVDVRPHLAVATGAAAARHVFEVACFAGLEKCEFDPFDSHQAHVVKQVKAAFDDATRPGDGADAAPVGPRLSALLRTALETGKAARDSRSCRAIGKLRGVALAGAALADARIEVAAAVSDGVVEPAVGKLADAFAARRRGIRRLQRIGDAAAPSPPAAGKAPRRAAKRALHEPSRSLARARRRRAAPRRPAAGHPRRHHRMESGIHRRASTHQRRPTEVLLHGSDAAACDRLRALRKAAVVDGLDGAARPVAWKLLLGVGRCDAKRYGALVARGPCGSGESIEADARRTFRSGSSHGAALLGAESSPASRRGARPLEDLFAFPLLASLFACAPPLAEVVVLWDALLALGVHSGVLLCAALCVSLRDELLLDPDPLARLQPRNLPPLDGRRLVAGAARLAPKIPPLLFDLVLRHPVDVDSVLDSATKTTTSSLKIEVKLNTALRRMACLGSGTSVRHDDGDGDVLGALERLGVDIVAPRGAREEAFASSLERFSAFVLEGERELCLGILDAHLERDDGSVGELQGGSDAHRIYRAVLPDDDGGDGGGARPPRPARVQRRPRGAGRR
ncbi:hypothetical protein JL721_658 [Aureococcus anophagefferens]|nr:hypothetical protein JL721_658 [Aureococcus anophagefferens]